nr:hypothetical protein [uncultured Methanobacterium sp.]
MQTKYLVGLLVLIVAIGGATACNYLLPSGTGTTSAVQSNPTPAVTAPVVNDSNTQEPTQEQSTSKKNVQAQTQTCVKCGGSGLIACSSCGGSGLLKGSCANCGGDGKVYIDGNGVTNPNVVQLVVVLACHEETCSVCGGTGGSKTSCTACGGDGKVTCPSCGGDGYT